MSTTRPIAAPSIRVPATAPRSRRAASLAGARALAWGLAVLALGALAAPPALALGDCQVSERKDGTLKISARGVSGSLRVGTSPEVVNGRFANHAECVSGNRARGCVLGDKGTLERTTHPPLCAVFLEDDADSCIAKVKGCTVGSRPTCPPDMERIGSTCIERVAGQDEFTEAVLTCTARGRRLCTTRELMTCDAANWRNGEAGSCGNYTDTSNRWMWTQDSLATDNQNLFSRIRVYRGDNLVRDNSSSIGSIYNYFCCAPLGTP